MGRNAMGEKKDAVLRVRITTDLDERITKMMVKRRYKGEKASFCAELVEYGLDLADVDIDAGAKAREAYLAGIKDHGKGSATAS